MEIIEKNGLRILTCEFGYLIYNKVTDTYSKKIYLGKFATIDDYEEVIDNTIDERMLKKINKIDNQISNLEQSEDLIAMLNEIINE